MGVSQENKQRFTEEHKLGVGRCVGSTRRGMGRPRRCNMSVVISRCLWHVDTTGNRIKCLFGIRAFTLALTTPHPSRATPVLTTPRLLIISQAPAATPPRPLAFYQSTLILTLYFITPRPTAPPLWKEKRLKENHINSNFSSFLGESRLRNPGVKFGAIHWKNDIPSTEH